MKRSAETTAVFESLPVLQALKIMALPTIISQLIVLIYNFADTFYVGKTNDPHMVAALSLILPVFFCRFYLVFFLRAQFCRVCQRVCA